MAARWKYGKSYKALAFFRKLHFPYCMRREHASYLKDPITFNPLTLTVFTESAGHIETGLLTNGQNWYPIINGIPRLLTNELRAALFQAHYGFLKQHESKLPPHAVDEWKLAVNNIKDLDRFLRHQKKTAESFAFEWRHIYRENNFEKNNFLHFCTPYLTERDFRTKSVVDIGCGSGRFTKQIALMGASVVFGADLGETVQVAYKLTKDLPNACIIQADIYSMPFRRTFDLALSIGVLHHLPEPRKGFSGLPSVLKPGGRMLIWVYNRRNNARAVYFYEPLRVITKHLPKRSLYYLCYPPALAVHAINQLTHLLNEWGAKKMAAKIPFSYYANFSFNMKFNDAFDVLATPKSNYYRHEEITEWFREARLGSIQHFEHPEAGITCTGIT